jgi:cytochrome c biogenesis protein CcmG, thiol:disulfide interchange protein DsbE
VSVAEKNTTRSDTGIGRRRLIMLIPLVAFLALAALFMYRLGSGDPSRIPSALIGRPAPATDLPPLPGLERNGKPVPGLESAAFKGEVTLLNVWSSWCGPCRDEAPLLLALAADRRFRIAGINYKDQADNARRFLGRYGNPFVANGVDGNGRASIEWGVYGVPETFVIDREGRIRYRFVGPLQPRDVDETLRPLLAQLQREQPRDPLLRVEGRPQ